MFTNNPNLSEYFIQNKTQPMETQTPSIKKNAAQYGLILGLVFAFITAVIYAVSIELLTKWWLGIIMFLIALGIGIFSVAKSKAILGGFISFKQAFTSYFITMAIGLFISIIVSILIFVVIDPEAAVYLQEQIVEMTRGMMESFGAPESEINKAIAEMESKNQYSLGSQLQGFIFQLAFYSVFGLLVALIMRKKDPNAIE